MDLGDSLKKSILGSETDEVIKAGTLLVTRGFGVIAVGLIGLFLLLDQLGDTGPWKDLATEEKLDFVLAVGLLWALIAAADAIARGLATPKQVVTLASGLTAKKTEGPDDPGWAVVAIRPAAGDGDGSKYLIAKAGKSPEWVDVSELSFDFSQPRSVPVERSQSPAP